jgi:hypothetical protein
MIVFAAVMTLDEAVMAQCLTIPAAVEQVRPQPLIRARISEMMVAPLDQAVKEADLIIIGTLTHPEIYLSEDKCTLYTDYVLAPTHVVSGLSKSRREPGDASIVVRTWGGETNIAGVPVKIYEENVRPLRTGVSYLLLLKFNSAISKYEIYDHGLYALEVGPDNRLTPAVKIAGLMNPALERGSLGDAIRIIQEKRSR